MKKVISLLLTAMLLLSMLPATMAEGVEYIPAPYALDAERATEGVCRACVLCQRRG